MDLQPDDYEAAAHGPPQCTASRFAPAVDVAVAALATAATVQVLATPDDRNPGALPVAGAAFAVSAITGNRAASSCRALRDEFEATLAESEEHEVREVMDAPLDEPIEGTDKPAGDSERAVGAEGGPCTAGGACDEGLRCDRETRLCRVDEEHVPIGAEGGPCTAGGGCDDGLVCAKEEGLCARPAGEEP